MSSPPPLRKLPLDLEEEILVRVPPRCLVRFRYVCKRWNALFNDKRFVNKQLSFVRPEFLLKTPSHMYSISVDLNNDDPPTIKVSDLCVDLCDRRYYLYGTCDGHFFIYDFHEGGVVSNLLLMRQAKETGEIRIWVTKNKIGNGDDGDHVVWIKFMTVSVPNFPILSSNNSTSYYVNSNPHGKSFFLCCPTKNNEEACIYIVRGDLCKKVKIDQVACEFQSSVYVPSQFDHHSLRDFP